MRLRISRSIRSEPENNRGSLLSVSNCHIRTSRKNPCQRKSVATPSAKSPQNAIEGERSISKCTSNHRSKGGRNAIISNPFASAVCSTVASISKSFAKIPGTRLARGKSDLLIAAGLGRGNGSRTRIGEARSLDGDSDFFRSVGGRSEFLGEAAIGVRGSVCSAMGGVVLALAFEGFSAGDSPSGGRKSFGCSRSSLNDGGAKMRRK